MFLNCFYSNDSSNGKLFFFAQQKSCVRHVVLRVEEASLKQQNPTFSTTAMGYL